MNIEIKAAGYVYTSLDIPDISMDELTAYVEGSLENYATIDAYDIETIIYEFIWEHAGNYCQQDVMWETVEFDVNTKELVNHFEYLLK